MAPAIESGGSGIRGHGMRRSLQTSGGDRRSDQALDRGIRKAMLRHKKDGLPVVIERDGKIESVKPEDVGY